MYHTARLDYQQVHQAYLNVMGEQVELTTESITCSPEVVWDVLGLASVMCRSIHASCDTLQDTPTGEAVLYQLRQGWLAHKNLSELEDEMNALVTHRLPERIRGGSHKVAIDVTYIPYHGAAHQSENEIRRSRAKSGTTHFHAYVSAYVIRKNKRVTVAVAYWQADESLFEVLIRVLDRLEALDIRIKQLLLDRQFASVKVIRYLEAQSYQTILALPTRNSTILKRLKREARRSHSLDYTMRSPDAGAVTFALHVVCRYAAGRRGKHGIDRLLFAVLGQPWQGRPYRLAQLYRSRFGVDTSYRLMNRVRARTSSRDPKLRLLFVALAFMLLNLWITLQWSILAVPRRGGRWLDLDLFRLHRFQDFLRDAIGKNRGFVHCVTRSASIPPGF